MRSNLIILVSCLLIISCSAKSGKEDSTVRLNLGHIVSGTAMDGGITVLSISSIGVKQLHDLDSSHSIVLQKGIYNFFTVGWSGPTLYNGNSYCGYAMTQDLIDDDQSVAMTISQSGCFKPEIQFVLKHQLGHMDVNIPGGQTGELLGSVGKAGDINGDGVGDWIVGAMNYDGTAGTDSGKAVVFSGKDYSVLFSIEGEAAGDKFGTSVDGAGDFDNDSHNDFVVGAKDGAGTRGKAYVFSGLDGSSIYSVSGSALGDDFAYSVAGVGDYNQDGYDDIIIGAPLENANGVDSGKFYIKAGPSGTNIHTANGEVANDKLGMTVASAGDYNSDGVPDITSCAELFDGAGTNRGKVYVLSGADNSQLFTQEGEADTDGFCKGLSSAGDFNGDGYDDLVVGASGNDTGGISRGKIYVYSGFDNSLLYSKTGSNNSDMLGAKVAGGFDWNGDGYSDIAVAHTGFDGVAGANTGLVEIISGGGTQTVLHSLEGAATGDLLGNTGMVGISDANDDGLQDLLIGAGSAGGGDGAFLIQ